MAFGVVVFWVIGLGNTSTLFVAAATAKTKPRASMLTD